MKLLWALFCTPPCCIVGWPSQGGSSLELKWYLIDLVLFIYNGSSFFFKANKDFKSSDLLVELAGRPAD
jgi:hypothetical protein